jgi:hypothetical protein
MAVKHEPSDPMGTMFIDLSALAIPSLLDVLEAFEVPCFGASVTMDHSVTFLSLTTSYTLM